MLDKIRIENETLKSRYLIACVCVCVCEYQIEKQLTGSDSL